MALNDELTIKSDKVISCLSCLRLQVRKKRSDSKSVSVRCYCFTGNVADCSVIALLITELLYSLA